MIELAVKHLTILDAGLAAIVLVGLLLPRRHATLVWWALSSALMVAFSFLFSRVGNLVYDDPRSVTAVHLKPLAPLVPFLPHLEHNSFPSSHAVFAAVIVSMVLFLSPRWTIPFVILGALDTWARVGLGPHQVVDIAGGWLIVALATLVAFVVGSIIAAVVLPAIPSSWTAERFRLDHANRHLGMT